ncbi:hypothetical protein BGX34_007788, partial [Mortierella sp. NVP85]
MSSDDTVNDLKKAIKAENSKTFGGIDAKDLTLWLVKIPMTPVRQISLNLPGEESIQNLNLEEGQEIQCLLNDVKEVEVKPLFVPSRTMSHEHVFGKVPLPDHTIDIIVQPPQS